MLLAFFISCGNLSGAFSMRTPPPLRLRVRQTPLAAMANQFDGCLPLTTPVAFNSVWYGVRIVRSVTLRAFSWQVAQLDIRASVDCPATIIRALRTLLALPILHTPTVATGRGLLPAILPRLPHSGTACWERDSPISLVSGDDVVVPQQHL